MTRMIKIGNAQAFWGDSPGAPAELLKQQPDLDYLTLDYLAEVSLSIMAIQRDKKPELGYAADFLDVVRSLIPFWKEGSHVKVVCNAGGLNPEGCAQAVVKILQQEGCAKKVSTVSGDDVLALLKGDSKKELFHNLDTGEPLEQVLNQLVTANAYLGAEPIAKALMQGADIVITGRVADPSLTVGPCLAHFNWKRDDWDKLAQATVAGHLIECGTQATGGISTHWLEMPAPENIGFPVVEMSEDSSFVITKPAKTGGRVNLQTIKEQLLYEIGDPERYLSPDVTVSFLSLYVDYAGPDRVKVTNAKGMAPPLTYKVSATFRDGYRAEACLSIFGKDAPAKAERAGQVILKKVENAGHNLANANIECLGTGGSVPGILNPSEAVECVMRIAVSDPQKEAVEAFSKEIAPLVTSGPQGIGGYLFGRPQVRPVFGYWPCLIEASAIKPSILIQN